MPPLPPSLTGDLCLSPVDRVVVCMSPPPPSLTGDLCLKLVGRAVVCSSTSLLPLPDWQLLFESCGQSSFV